MYYISAAKRGKRTAGGKLYDAYTNLNTRLRGHKLRRKISDKKQSISSGLYYSPQYQYITIKGKCAKIIGTLTECKHTYVFNKIYALLINIFSTFIR